MLALPYGVSCVGVWGSVSLFALAGTATYYSNTILFDCVLETGHGSYGQLMSDILGKYGGAQASWGCLELGKRLSQQFGPEIRLHWASEA